MNNIFSSFFSNFVRRPLWASMLGALVLTLASCGSTQLDDVTIPSRFAHVATVAIEANADQADVEARYNGSAVVFRPEAGFAVLGLHEPLLGTHGKPGGSSENQEQLVVPEMTASGYTAWAGGYTAWAGGYTAWAGGYTAWAGGSTEPTTFGENLPLWEQINLAEAHQLAPTLGAGVKVAVIDTGLDLAHPALQGKLVPASEWKDFVDGDDVPQDEPDPSGDNSAFGHGTAVAGVILQVAPEATILPIRALGPNGAGDVTSVTAAIDWAVQQGAQVINLSLGATSDIKALDTVIRNAINYGVLVVASAGNTGDSRVTYPAANAETPRSGGNQMIGVGSVDLFDLKSSFSTHGPDLEMVAPGEQIHTLYPDGRVTSAVGTSFAAPIVAGAAALAKAQTDLPASTIEGKLRSTAAPVATLNPAYDLGEGRLDVRGFLQGLGL